MTKTTLQNYIKESNITQDNIDSVDIDGYESTNCTLTNDALIIFDGDDSNDPIKISLDTVIEHEENSHDLKLPDDSFLTFWRDV
jgi:hypothetical protein